MYLKRDGTRVKNLPVLADYVETSYIVELYDERHNLLDRIENGGTYPSETQRRFYLLKHSEAEYISVKRVYRRTM